MKPIYVTSIAHIAKIISQSNRSVVINYFREKTAERVAGHFAERDTGHFALTPYRTIGSNWYHMLKMKHEIYYAVQIIEFRLS